MSSRYLRQFVLTQDPRQVIIAGNASLSAAAAVSSTDFNSLVESFTKTAVGTYQLKLKDKYQTLRSVNVTVEGQVTASAVISSTDVSSTKIIEIKTVVGGVVADVTAASKLHVNLVLKDSTAR